MASVMQKKASTALCSLCSACFFSFGSFPVPLFLIGEPSLDDKYFERLERRRSIEVIEDVFHLGGYQEVNPCFRLAVKRRGFWRQLRTGNRMFL